MVRTRSGLFLAAVGIASLGASVACNKDSDKKASDNKAVEKDTAGAKAPAPGTDKAAAAPAATPPAEALKADSPPPANPNADDLNLLPADSEFVIGVNWKQLTSSALWKQYVAPKMASDANFQGGLAKFKTICAFDPMDSITSISVGFHNVGAGQIPDGAIVVHGLDRTKSMTCFDKDGVTEAEKDGTKVTIEDNVVVMQKGTDPAIGFTFVNDTTALGVIGVKAASVASVKEVANGKTALATSQKFVELYNKVNTTDSVWGLVNIAGSKMLSEQMAKMPMNAKMQAAYGSINITDGVTADIRVRMATPDQAASMAAMAKSQAASAAMFTDKLDINAEGADLHTSVTISPQKLQTLLQFAQMGAASKGAHGGAAKGGGGLLGSP